MAAEKSMGVSLTVGDVVVAGLTSIGEIGGESSEIDVTSLDAPDGYKQFLMSLKDGGEIPLKGFVKDDSNMDDLIEMYEDQTLEPCVVAFPSGRGYEFDAYVKMAKEGESTPEGARGFTASLRVSGKITATNEVSA